MDETNIKQEGKEGEGKRKAGIWILVLAIVVLAGFNIYLLLRKEAPAPVEETEETRRNVVVESDNANDLLAQMATEEYVPPAYYTVTMNYEWHFPTGSEASTNAYVENRTVNENDVYFDLVLASDEERVLYRSPVIPLGMSLQGFALDEPLAVGTYDGVVIYHLVDEDQNTLSTLRVTVTIVVEG